MLSNSRVRVASNQGNLSRGSSCPDGSVCRLLARLLFGISNFCRPTYFKFESHFSAYLLDNLLVCLAILCTVILSQSLYYHYNYEYYLMHFNLLSTATSTPLLTNNHHHHNVELNDNNNNNNQNNLTDVLLRFCYEDSFGPIEYATQTAITDYIKQQQQQQTSSGADDSTEVHHQSSGARLNLLLAKLEEAKESLNSVGAPFERTICKFPFGATCFYCLWIGLTYLMFIQNYVYFRFVQPFDSYIMRLIENPSKERDRHQRELVQNQVKLVLESYENYLNNYLANNWTQALPCWTGAGGQSSVGVNLYRQLRLSFEATKRSLQRLVRNEQLSLVNRSNDAIRLLVTCYGSFSLFAYSFVLTSLGVQVAVMHELGFQFDGMDLLILVCLGLVTCFIAICGVFYLFLPVITLIDQVKLINHLEAEYQACIRLNSWHHFKSITAVVPLHSFKVQVNYQLLALLLKHKLFFLQLKSSRNLFNMATRAITQILFFNPLVLKLHSVYLTTTVKAYFLIIILIATILCDFCLVPVCYLQERCNKLQSLMSNLLANLNEIITEHQNILRLIGAEFGPPDQGPRRVSSSIDLENIINIYDQHTIHLLRKEYCLHELRIDEQFSKSTFKIAFNYSNLLRIHFWMSILILSICFDSQTDLLSLFKDPLNLGTLDL